MKKTYVVDKREVWVQPVLIEAESKEEALKLVANGEGEYWDNSLEYSQDLSIDKWVVCLHKDD